MTAYLTPFKIPAMTMHYRDRKIIFFGVLIITLLGTFLGTYHTLEEILSSPIILKKLLFNAGEALIGWLLVKHLIQYFDKIHPWESDTRWQRWSWQILASQGVGICLFVISLGVRTQFIPEWSYIPKTVWLTDFPLLGLFVLLVNFVYYYLYTQQAIQQQSKKNFRTPNQANIKVAKGKKTVLLPVQNIAYAFRSNDCNFVVNIDNERFLLDGSLSKLQAQLPADSFYRLNRQTIAHRQAISSYAVQPNRQLAVELTPSLINRTQVNKNNIANFKRWVQEAV